MTVSDSNSCRSCHDLLPHSDINNSTPRRSPYMCRPSARKIAAVTCLAFASFLLLLFDARSTPDIELLNKASEVVSSFLSKKHLRGESRGPLDVKEEGNAHTRQRKSRVLATISPLGFVPIRSDANGTLANWLVLSAVPTVAAHQSTSKKTRYQLALVGDQRIGGSAAKSSNTFAGNHYAVFPSGEKRQFAKYESIKIYAASITWFSDLPDGDATYWYDPANATGDDRTNVCLKFQIWNDTAHVQTFESCHNPSVLPSLSNPRNLVFCPNKPSFHKKGNEAFSGFISMLPNIIYHLRHGVDQFTIFIPPIYRDETLRMLEPFGESVTIVLIGPDVPRKKIADGDYKFHAGNMAASGKYRIGGHEVDAINWLSNDCLNRFRGRARLMKMSHDWDEFHYAPSWRDLGPRWSTDLAQTSLSAHLQPFVEDAASSSDVAYHKAMWYKWMKPLDKLHSLPTDTRLREKKYPIAFGKSFIVPDKVEVQWVHLPSNCFGAVCKQWSPRPATLSAHTKGYKLARPDLYQASETFSEYAHFRLLPTVNDTRCSDDPKHAFADDNFFASETVELEKILRDMLKYDGRNAKTPFGPLLWLPS
eukprot:GEMP01019000.1.p1 GENE.GEMP01019000.1~~GEMP01019000.1.p1  ORF type:complete len:591 (+),score=96.40 GEMP01019000.1:125-1897(+)